MSTIAIIAALDRELAPLVHDWKSVSFSHNGRNRRAYWHHNVIAIAGGIGGRAAGAAARAVMAEYKPQMLISAGLAGALLHTLKVGSVVTPNVIIDAASGTEYRCQSGSGVLVTAGAIASKGSKRELVERFHAVAVDMEAAAVAEVAQQQRIGLGCVKAISDETDFMMPPLARFVDENGNFQTGKFVGWTALRPHYWRRTVLLARHSRLAIQALCTWLAKHLDNGVLPAAVIELSGSAGGSEAGERRADPGRSAGTLSGSVKDGDSGPSAYKALK
jgi:nucleoside phosphorylase